jgi:hypothetical protein
MGSAASSKEQSLHAQSHMMGFGLLVWLKPSWLISDVVRRSPTSESVPAFVAFVACCDGMKTRACRIMWGAYMTSHEGRAWSMT